MSAAVLPSRRSRALHQERDEPSAVEIALGLAGFLILVSACLALVAALGA